jgi:predicted transcriptional regulator
MPDPTREITGGYAGDLLSWVMGRANSGDVWVTIMSNVNIVAVASLADPACILLSEGVELEDEVIEKANSVGVNILTSKDDTFALCASIAKYL